MESEADTHTGRTRVYVGVYTIVSATSGVLANIAGIQSVLPSSANLHTVCDGCVLPKLDHTAFRQQKEQVCKKAKLVGWDDPKYE